MKRFMVLGILAMVVVGCSGYQKVVVKDIPLEEQKLILDTYKNRSAWSRGVLEDIGDGGSLPRDTKVKIVDVGMHYTGDVTVQTLRRKDKFVHALELERPLSKEQIDAKMEHLFWFKDPTLRQVDYIRKWGKKTARAIVNHEVFIGMSAEAAIESWGFPAKKNVSEIGGKKNEQWVYPSGKRNKYIYVTEGKISKWDE